MSTTIATTVSNLMRLADIHAKQMVEAENFGGNPERSRDALQAALVEALQAAGVEDPVTVPRGVLGAACSAIDHKRDAPKLLEKLRRYTVGDLSRGPTQPLTDDQILQIASTIPRDDLIHDFARAIERAHGITGGAING